MHLLNLSTLRTLWLIPLLFLAIVPYSADASSQQKKDILIEAFVRGTNAHQGLLARRQKLDETCFGTSKFSVSTLENMVAQQKELSKIKPEALRSWLEESNSQDASKNVDTAIQTLATQGPVASLNNAIEIFKTTIRAQGKKASRLSTSEILALANLHQIVLEIDRDGDILQDLFNLYHALELPISLQQVDFPGDGASLRRLSQDLSKATCSSPYDTSPRAWRIALQKIWNWGAKFNGTRNTATLVEELLNSSEVKSLAPALQKAEPRRILVIGHSFTMERHWSSPSAFVPIVAGILKTLGSEIVITQQSAGGLDASWAYKEFLQKAIQEHPTEVYLVVTATNAKDKKSLGQFIRSLKTAGIKVAVFDSVDFFDPYKHDETHARQAIAIAKKAGADILEVQSAYDELTHKMRKRHLSLDGVHMTEPFHRAMALEWLRTLARERPLAHQPSSSIPTGEVAFTFDDAPMEDDLLMTGRKRTRLLIDALKNADSKGALFFINTFRLDKSHGRKRLQEYVKAGHFLGNHTHSHPNLSEVGADFFIQDKDKAHDLLSKLPGFVPFFRYPYSKEGKDSSTQEAVRQSISAQAYQQGYFTIDAADWYWNFALLEAARLKRKDLQNLIVDLYVKATWESVLHYDALAKKVTGRQPKHVLVMHETDLNALAIKPLIQLLHKNGWKIISALDAYKDPISIQVPRGFHTQYRVAGLAENKNLSGPIYTELVDTDRINDLLEAYNSLVF